MMDLLKRFEEDGLDDDPFAHREYSDDEGGGGDDDGDGDDLERRLAGLDLGECRCFPGTLPGHENTLQGVLPRIKYGPP